MKLVKLLLCPLFSVFATELLASMLYGLVFKILVLASTMRSAGEVFLGVVWIVGRSSLLDVWTNFLASSRRSPASSLVGSIVLNC